MPLDLSNDKSTLVQVMAWCRQATSHYLSQCWLRSMSPFSITRPQCVNSSPPSAPYMRQWTGSVRYGSYNGLAPVRRQAISWTNTDLLSIGPLGTNFSEIRIKIHNFSIIKMFWKCHLRYGGHFVRGRWVKSLQTLGTCSYNLNYTLFRYIFATDIMDRHSPNSLWWALVWNCF